MKHWKGYERLISSLCDWIFAAFVAETLAVIGMSMNWDIMDIHADILRPQGGKDIRPAARNWRD